MAQLQVVALGPTRYRDGLALMDELVAARAAGATGDWLLFPDHEPVLTVGRNPSEGNLIADRETLARAGIELHEVTRGGDVTWHGPGQLVAYPVVGLDLVGRDLHRWLRTLEDVVIAVLARHGLEGRRVVDRTGVWLSEHEKIASIGVAVRRWVGYHGVALNVSNSLADFDLIHPCGLHGIRMTSMAERLGDRVPSLARVRADVTAELVARLGYDGFEEVPASAFRARAGIAAAEGASNRGTAGTVPGEPGGTHAW